jgi:SSS family solute:Na+ symporter
MIASLMLLGGAALALWLVVLAARGRTQLRSVTELESWSIGGRQFGATLVFLLLAGEIYTTFAVLGGSGWAYGKGGAAMYVVAYSPLAFVTSYWLLPRIWRYAKRTGAVSQSDFFATTYRSTGLGHVVTVVGVIAMVPYLTLQLTGASLIVAETSYGRVSPAVATICGGVLLVVYSMIGGLRGAALNAVIKDVLILATMLALAWYLPRHLYGGWGAMFQAVDAAHRGHTTLRSSVGYGVPWFVSTVLLSAAGFYLWPHLFAATFSARHERVFRRNAVLLPMYNLLLLFSLIIGFTALATTPGLTGSAQDLALLRLVKAELNPIVVGIIGVAGLLTALVPGAVLATTIGTLLARNGYAVLRPNATDAQVSRVARLIVPLVVAVTAVLVFRGGTTVVNLLLVGYAFITQMIPALLCGFLRRNPLEKCGATAGIVVGVLAAGVSVFGGIGRAQLLRVFPEWLAEINVGIYALALNVIVALTVSCLVRGSRAGDPGALRHQDRQRDEQADPHHHRVERFAEE